MKKRLFISFLFLDDPCCQVGSELCERHQIYDAATLFNGEFTASEAILQAEIFGRNTIIFNLANFDSYDDEMRRQGFQILKCVFRYLYPQSEFLTTYDSMIIDYESSIEAPQDILDELKHYVLF